MASWIKGQHSAESNKNGLWISRCQTGVVYRPEKTWNPPKEQQKVDVCMSKWAGGSAATWLEQGFLLVWAALLGAWAPREPGSRRWPPVLHQETMATRHSVTAGDRNRHKRRNCLFCHWGRPAEAWECGGGTLSLSACVLSICPNVTRTVMHLLTVRCY